MGSQLNVERSRARSRAYSLLARLLDPAPTERTLAAARMSPEIERALKLYPDIDALLADHEHVFGLVCPPFESALLDPGARLGGAISDRVRATLSQIGVVEGPGGAEPEHLATELYVLALLSGAEADALADDAAAACQHMRGLAQKLLDAHLLRFLPMYALAVRRSERPWPIALIDTIEEVVLEHRAGLGAPNPEDLRFELPEPAIGLDAEETGLAEVARFLATPARAGVVITRDDILRVGRSTSTPRGFGERALVLENLLRSAAELGSLEPVIDSLSALVVRTSTALGHARLADVPPAFVEPWRWRSAWTGALLGRIREANRERR